MHRTYVRRRVTMFALALGATVLLAGPVTSALGADTGAMRPVAERTYVIEPGDTLWAIATQLAGGRDPREVVQQLEATNQIDAASLEPGMVLHLPSAR